MRSLNLFLLAVAAACVVAAPARAEEKWQNLFDGKTLDGWVQRNGKATYAVEDGVIVGTSAQGSPNSFLCTKRDYGNFVLELDFKVDPRLNSGIQVRSESKPDHDNGRVHGYQVEIDPAEEPFSGEPVNRRADGSAVPAGAEPRRWTGGIYDEARRGWLCTLAENEPARRAFKPGEWNHFRIAAQGDLIEVELNGVKAGRVNDAMTPKGFIALQVHGTDSREPLEVRWKNIRLQERGPNEARDAGAGR